MADLLKKLEELEIKLDKHIKQDEDSIDKLEKALVSLSARQSILLVINTGIFIAVIAKLIGG